MPSRHLISTSMSPKSSCALLFFFDEFDNVWKFVEGEVEGDRDDRRKCWLWQL